MASVYKRRELRPIPQGAELVTYRGRRYATWKDAKGTAQRAPVNADETKIIQERPGYVVCYVDHTGERVRVNTRFPDKDSAQQYANKLELDAENRRTGMIDPSQERFAKEARRPITEHVDDFRQHLTAKQRDGRYVALTAMHIKTVVEACKAQNIGDLTGAAVMQAVAQLRDGGASLRTCNSYLRDIKALTRWLWRERRTPDDALAGLAGFNEATDRRHIRRELTPEESAYLLAYVERDTNPCFNLAGPDRAMVYRLALGTGFRAKELRSLTSKSFDLDADPPAVTVAAAYSKRRRQDLQPIRQDLAELLRPWLAGRPRDAELFGRLPSNTARMLRLDLAAARQKWLDDETLSDAKREARQRSDFLQYRNAAGEVADFHATRHTYISGIVAGGKASVKTAMELARHSTPTLTIGRYAHARLHDLTAALDALPDLTPKAPEGQELRATGTTGAGDAVSVDVRGERNGERAGGKTCRNVAERGGLNATGDDATEAVAADDETPQVITLAGRGDMRENAAGQETERGAGGSRTRGRRFAICQQPQENTGKTRDSETAGSATGSAPAENRTLPQDLQGIIDAWPTLPEAIKAGILAMVQAAGGKP